MGCFSWFRSAVLAENRPAGSFRFRFKEPQTEESLKKTEGKTLQAGDFRLPQRAISEHLPRAERVYQPPSLYSYRLQ